MMLCCTVLCCAALRCAVLHFAVLCCAVLFCAVLCYALLCCAVLCCAVLCSAVLCCAVLCCAVLGWAGLGWAWLGWPGWAGLGLARPGRAGLGWAGLCQAGPDWAGLDWVDWSGPGSAPKMVKTNGKIQRISSSRLCPHRFSNRNNLCKRLSKENSSLVVERETNSVLTKKEQLRVTVPWSPKMLPFSGRNFKAVFRNRISSFSTTANFRNFYSHATCEILLWYRNRPRSQTF